MSTGSKENKGNKGNYQIQMIPTSKNITKADRELLLRCYARVTDALPLSILEHQIDRDGAFVFRQVLDEGDGPYTVYVSIVQRLYNKDTGEKAHLQIVSGGLDNKGDWDQVQAFYEWAGRAEGVDYLKAVGRRGWLPKAQANGYTLTREYKNINNKKMIEVEKKLCMS